MRKKRLLSKKILHILAVAALSVSLISGQMQSVLAEDPVNTVTIEDGRMLFDAFYIEEGVSLSEIKFPEYAEGTLQWEDKEYIPDESEAECVIIFKPNKEQNLENYKYLEGWDPVEKVVKVKVKVIVGNFSEEYSGNVTGTIENEFDNSSEISNEVANETTEEIIEGNVVEEVLTETTGEEITENNVVGEIITDEIAEEMPEESGKDVSGIISTEEVVEDTTEEITSEEIVLEESANETATEEAIETTEKEVVTEISESADTTEEAVNNSETINESTASTGANESENIAKDIFNREIEYSKVDETSTIIYEDLSEEEKQKIAEENHCSNGVTVSGENLPWYVQFRAYEVEESMFSINSDANVFQCFEFELWDLLNDTEYVIPDGEYVSVSIPIIEGYEYTVEHILESGAIEMITPTVIGSTLVFSTNTFSPFGIAGSTPIIGGEIIDDGYQIPSVQPTATPTPQPTVTTKPTVTPTVGSAASTTPTAMPTPTTGTSVGGQTVLVGEDVEAEDGVIDRTTSDKNTQQTATVGTNNNSTTKRPVQTGDTTVMIPFVILVAVAGVAIVLVIVLKKRKDD